MSIENFYEVLDNSIFELQRAAEYLSNNNEDDFDNACVYVEGVIHQLKGLYEEMDDYEFGIDEAVKRKKKPELPNTGLSPVLPDAAKGIEDFNNSIGDVDCGGMAEALKTIDRETYRQTGKYLGLEESFYHLESTMSNKQKKDLKKLITSKSSVKRICESIEKLAREQMEIEENLDWDRADDFEHAIYNAIIGVIADFRWDGLSVGDVQKAVEGFMYHFQYDELSLQLEEE